MDHTPDHTADHTIKTASVSAGPLNESALGGATLVRAAMTTTSPAEPLRISAGVSQGMLLTPIRPVYPSIALTAHIEGSVVVEAIISKQGKVQSVHAVSGPAMLRDAAVEAVRAARYQPYRLNEDPIEVQTTITIAFQRSH